LQDDFLFCQTAGTEPTGVVSVKRVLVANRGEIALRAVRARRKLGLESVAVHSVADRNSLHIWAADRSVCLGPAPSAASYLNAGVQIEAARDTGCDAVYLGELVVSGTERNEMPERAASALARFDVAGISITTPFHSWLIARREFIYASAHTGWVEQEMLA
jgi:acetyl/propionyl-CoA carboxylase alpha subunit